ncbi:hypothetical protein DL990_13100 [Amycolatopsis sp. WAC 01416]|nr:hypothetical protein DL990_13100 [Amycolatopsis sp. WAC 01416]
MPRLSIAAFVTPSVSVDPEEGGSANDYDYVADDPTNSVDLDGHGFWGSLWNEVKAVARVVTPGRRMGLLGARSDRDCCRVDRSWRRQANVLSCRCGTGCGLLALVARRTG